LFLGRIRDEEHLRNVLASIVKSGKCQILNGPQDQPNRDKEYTAVITSGFVVLGKTENVLVYLDQLRNGETLTSEKSQSFVNTEFPGAAVVTYTNERDSVESSLSALMRFNGHSFTTTDLQKVEGRLAHVFFSTTQTRLNENGIDRRTQSALGQFGNLLSLAVADSSDVNKR
jgi:hypothetical protein